MNRERRSILARVRKHGLRVMCVRCGLLQRHFPQIGRLREQLCHGTGCSGALRSLAWIDRNPGRWAELVDQDAKRSAPFTRV